jgi:hypothetical protein
VLDSPIHKEIFPYISPLLPIPNFPFMIYPAQIVWSFQTTKRNGYYVYSNEPLFAATMSALAGAEQALVQLRATSNIVERGTATVCFLTAVYVQNYTAECIVVRYRQIFVTFRRPQYCSYVTCDFHCNFQCKFHCYISLDTLPLCKKDYCRKNTKSQRTCGRAPKQFPTKQLPVISCLNLNFI